MRVLRRFGDDSRNVEKLAAALVIEMELAAGERLQRFRKAVSARERQA